MYALDVADYNLNDIPAPLWKRVRARAKREGRTVRFLMLGWMQRYVNGRPGDMRWTGGFSDEGELIDAAQEGTTRGRK